LISDSSINNSSIVIDAVKFFDKVFVAEVELGEKTRHDETC
jgi:hypothetical protein